MKTGTKFAALGAIAALSGALTGAALPSAAQATSSPQLTYAVNTGADQASLQQVQYIWGGRNYCWYDGGWHGPGWYWCGYAWRRGFGWGGGYGWRGWAWHGHGGGWHGGYGPGHGPHGGPGPHGWHHH